MLSDSFVRSPATYYILHNKKYDKKYYVVRLGKKLGNKSYKTKTFKEGQETERDLFIQNWNEALKKNDGSSLNTLSSIQLAKINLCLKKLEGTGIELETCVDFYLKHHTSVNTNTKIGEVLEFYEKLRIEKGDRKRSITDAKLTTLRPFIKQIKNKSIGSVTKQDVRKFLFSNEKWSIATRGLHKRNLSAFFNLLQKNGFANINPVTGIDLPKQKAKEKLFYKPFELWLYLDTCLQNKRWSMLGGAVLASLFGARLRETTRISFSQINWEQKRIVFFSDQTKTGGRRVLYRTNAGMAWLKWAAEFNKEKYISSNYALEVVQTKIKKALQKFGKYKGIKITEGQNLLRQAFEAHAYEMFSYDLRTLSEVSGNSEETLKSNYNGIISNPDDAIAYFNIYPRLVFTDGLDIVKKLNLLNQNIDENKYHLYQNPVNIGQIKIVNNEAQIGQLIAKSDNLKTEKEFEAVEGTNVASFELKEFLDICKLGETPEEKLIKKKLFQEEFGFDPTNEKQYADLLFTKKYLEIQLGEEIWNIRLELE